jgi:hypothetical protein
VSRSFHRSRRRMASPYRFCHVRPRSPGMNPAARLHSRASAHQRQKRRAHEGQCAPPLPALEENGRARVEWIGRILFEQNPSSRDGAHNRGPESDLVIRIETSRDRRRPPRPGGSTVHLLS